jgi:hypothetical protein
LGGGYPTAISWPKAAAGIKAQPTDTKPIAMAKQANLRAMARLLSSRISAWKGPAGETLSAGCSKTAKDAEKAEKVGWEPARTSVIICQGRTFQGDSIDENHA